MRVLNVITTNFDTSGITNNLLKYLKYMNNKDIIVDFLIPNTPTDYVKKQIEAKGGNVFIKNRKYFFSYILGIRRLNKKMHYDIAHIHGNSATIALDLFAAWISGIKNRIAHSRNTSCKHKYLDKLLRPIFYSLYTDAYACGQEAGKWLFKNRAFKVVNNGNELDTFLFNQLNRDRIRNDLRIDKKLVIGHIGSFNDQKNHEFIIELFKEYHKRNNASSLLLVGIGKNELLIKQKVKELGLTTHVHFLGKILDVHNLYSAMDIFILPSKFEGFPNVVIEAQISGLDIILSQNITSEVNICGNLKYLSIDDGVGSWIKEFLTTKFNNRIERSINNSKILKENGYDIRENAKHLETKYLEILNR